LHIGGGEVARPLRYAAIPAIVSQTAYLCWHLVSATLVLMALLFFAAAVGWETGLSATALALAFAGVGILLPPMIGQTYRLLPQGWLFVPVVALGTWGLL
ncbi:MAG: hypothetical protein AAFY03_03725, partial [Pseudomonadota bacterium]